MRIALIRISLSHYHINRPHSGGCHGTQLEQSVSVCPISTARLWAVVDERERRLAVLSLLAVIGIRLVLSGLGNA